MSGLVVGLAVLASSPDSAGFPYAERPFEPLRDLHQAAYETPFAWRRAWERERLAASGIQFAHGSLSQHDLYLERRIVLNAPAGRWLFRYEREELGLPEPGIDERLEIAVTVAGPVSFFISGFPQVDKSKGNAGGGVRIAGAPEGWRPSYFEARVSVDDPFFNQRTEYQAQYRRPALHWQGEANLERGAGRIHAKWDVSHGSRLVFQTPAGSEGVADRRQQTHRTEVSVEYAPRPWLEAGVRHRWNAIADRRAYFPGNVDPATRPDDFDFVRAEHRLSAFVEARLPQISLEGHAEGIAQADRAGFGLGPGYTYTRTSGLAGVRARKSLGEGVEIGLGYWGVVQTIERDGAVVPAGRFPARGDRNSAGYADKADVLLSGAIGERIRGEMLLSHQVTRGRFGGGGLRASVLF